MRLILYTLTFLFLGCGAASAQIYSVTATGTTTQGYGSLLSNVSAGADFTFTFTFDASSILNSYPGSFSGAYATPSGTATISVGGNMYTDNVGTGVVIFSDSTGGPFGPVHGFFIGGTSSLFGSIPLGTPDPTDLEIDLESANPAVAPNISLSSLQTSPISDFYSATLSLNLNQNTSTGSDLRGELTNFSVTVSPAPEPSISSLVVFSIILVAFATQSSRKAASQI